jgi:hypothetical protein
MRKQLVRDLKREGLARLEESARTEYDFEPVIKRWDQLDANRKAREEYNETLMSGDMFDWSVFDEEDNMRTKGDFFPLIFPCACKIHELVDDPDISRLLNKATEKQKMVFFPRVLKGCTTKKIARCYDMTDRNVRKLIDLMLDNLRRDLYHALKNRYKTDSSKATLREKVFLANYIPKKKGKEKVSL